MCSSGIRGTCPSLPRMKNRSGPAKVLPLGIKARAPQAIPTPGLFEVGPWLLSATWLRPVLLSDDSSTSDSSLDTVEAAGHSNFPGFGGTERQGRQDSQQSLWLSRR